MVSNSTGCYRGTPVCRRHGIGLDHAIHLISLGLERFRNYCGLIKIARSGFPWEKTTKGSFASVYTNCETAVARQCAVCEQTSRVGDGARLLSPNNFWSEDYPSLIIVPSLARELEKVDVFRSAQSRVLLGIALCIVPCR
jgi:hypothetical protein